MILTKYVKEVCQKAIIFSIIITCIYHCTARPVVPTEVMVISVTGSTAIITWTVPYVELTSELYTVLYGLSEDALDTSSSIPGFSDVTLLNQSYTIALTQLDALTTYYFQIQSENSELSSLTDIMQFQTTEGGKHK